MRILAAIFVLSVMLAAQAPPPRPQPAPAAPKAAAQAKDSTAAETRRLLDLMGASQMINTMVERSFGNMMQAFAKLRPDIPQAFWADFAHEVHNQVHAEDLIERIIPIYEKHFTAGEIRELIAFYQTPVGKKVIGELPRIQEEAAQVGQQWGEALGRQIGEQVVKKAAEKGYETGTPPKPPE
ncbi:MAG: DUF2059 domain-containing protein [Terriglobales bacterium]